MPQPMFVHISNIGKKVSPIHSLLERCRRKYIYLLKKISPIHSLRDQAKDLTIEKECAVSRFNKFFSITKKECVIKHLGTVNNIQFFCTITESKGLIKIRLYDSNIKQLAITSFFNSSISTDVSDFEISESEHIDKLGLCDLLLSVAIPEVRKHTKQKKQIA